MAIHRKIAKHSNHKSSKSKIFLLLLFIIGLFIIFTGIIILVVAAMLSDGSINFGAVIFIGPFPIVVGAGPEATWMVLFAIILAVLSIIMLLVSSRGAKKANV